MTFQKALADLGEYDNGELVALRSAPNCSQLDEPLSTQGVEIFLQEIPSTVVSVAGQITNRDGSKPSDVFHRLKLSATDAVGVAAHTDQLRFA
jgi:hypothetical protein